ncbi:MAG: trigger factor, partial [Candidatus Bipolaricaulia bacterium]
MKTRVEEKGPTSRLIEVELPKEIVARKLEEVYRQVARDIELPGFRRGHVPRPLLEARFGQDFLYEDSQKELIQEYLPQALEEAELRPVAEPKTEVVQFEEGKPFIFQIEVEVLPEVEVEDYLGIEVEAEPKPRVTKKEVQKELDRLRREHATLLPKQGEAEVGDVVIVSERIVDSQGTAVSEERGIEVELEEDDEFSAKLLGRRAGEEVEIPLDEEHRSLIRIEEVKRVELPPLDEEFAKDLGHESIEELEEKVKEDLRERFSREHEQRMKLIILDELIDRTPLTIPEKLIEQLTEDLEGLAEEELAEERRRRVRRLKRELVLNTIKSREGLELSDEEFEEELRKEAEWQGLNSHKLKGLLEREGRLKEFRRSLER